MKNLKSHPSSTESRRGREILNLKNERAVIFGVGFIILLFFLLRLINLTLLPIFADEAIYIRWAQVMKNEPTLRFLPLADGKQPLYMWILMVILKLFANPLLAGRVLSVIAGLGSLIGIMILTLLAFKNKKISLLAGLFYAVIPFFVFFDRMALVDSLLTSLGIWTFIGGILLVRSVRLDLAMITGIILGLALITKSPAIFFALLLPGTIFLTDWKIWKNGNKTAIQLIKLIGLWSVVGFFAIFIYNLLRLGPNFAMIATRNKDYVFSFGEVFSHPFDPLRPHLNDLWQWLPNLLTWPIFILSFIGFLGGLRKKEERKGVIFLLLASFLPVFIQSVFARVFTPRYILFAVWPCLVLAAAGTQALMEIKILSRRVWLFGLIIVLVIPSLSYDWRLLTNPQKAPLPRKMRSGYLEEWSSGYGIKEAVGFINLRLLATSQNIVVGTEGYFGTLPDGFQIYFDQQKRVVIVGVGQPVREVPISLLEATINNQVYLLVNQSRMLVSGDSRLTLLEKFPKAVGPNGQDFLLLYQVKNDFL